MLFPEEWKNILTTYCQNIKQQHENDIFIRINAAAQLPHNAASEAARFLYELSDFKEFGKAIAWLQATKPDVSKVLPPSRDENGAVINDFFVKQVGPWECHFYRDAASHRSLGVLLFHKRDRPKRLVDALRDAPGL